MSPIIICFCLFIMLLKFNVFPVFGYRTEDLDPYLKALGKKEAEEINIVRTQGNVPIFMDSAVETYFQKESSESVHFKCEPKGTPSPNITWYKNNIAPVTRKRLPVTYNIWSLIMNDLAGEDSARYKCSVCNGSDCAQREFVLNVTDTTLDDLNITTPTISKGYPGNKTAEVQKSVELVCLVTANTEHTTDWYKVTTSNNTATKFRLWKGGIEKKGKYVISDDKLTIHNVNKTDEGWYKCETENEAGRDESITGYLTVVTTETAQDFANRNMQWYIPTALILVCISIVMVTVVYLKLRRKRTMKKPAMESERGMVSEKWTKFVTIQRAESNGYIKGHLQIPVVQVEKKKLSAVKGTYTSSIDTSEYVFPVDTDWEVSRKHLNLGKVLGEGEFGRVVQAECVKLTNSDTPRTVAVKMLKEGHSDADIIAFVSEMEIMKIIGKHENIINLLGCCTQDGPPYVIVEYASNGCLRKYLKKHKLEDSTTSTENLDIKQLTQKDLLEFSLQVAKGMEYLSSRGCIHRDLAARNVLVSESLVLKVADFGLARDVRDSDYYRKHTAGKLPVRWMAPESLAHNYYTTKSDVWSFGVLIWEIMTFGNTPYSQIPVHYLYNYLRLGKRMEKPNNCGQDLYDLMKHCCSFTPEDRPTFTEVKEKLQTMYSNT